MAVFVLVDHGDGSEPDAAALMARYAPLLERVAGLAVLCGSRLIHVTAEACSEDVFPSPVAAADALFVRQAGLGHDLLFLYRRASVNGDAVDCLAAVLDRDPMFSCVAPRLIAGPGMVAPLPQTQSFRPAVPLATLKRGPDITILPELLAPAMLLRGSLRLAMGPLTDEAPDLPAALLLWLAQARCRGYRPVVSNRVVIRAPDPLVQPGIDAERQPQAEWDKLPGWRRVVVEALVAPAVGREAALARLDHPDPAVANSVVIDAICLPGRHTGVAESALRLLEALDQLEFEVPPLLFVSSAAEAFFGLKQRLRQIKVETRGLRRRFAVALQLEPPWSLFDLQRPHLLASRSVFLVHDTIAVDSIHPTPLGAELVWRLMARTADGFAFNSAFTRDRFLTRFPEAAGVAQAVTRFSLAPQEYGRPGSEDGADLFVVGNPFHHKGLRETVAALAERFPDRTIQCLGWKEGELPANVRVLVSGELPQETIDRLFATAAAVVFPSFYEGFGFPVLRGLAAGRTVLARSSALLDEIAGHYRGPGRLIPFVSTAELLERVAAVLAGGGGGGLPLGGALAPDQPPGTWQDTARALWRLLGAIARPDGGDPRRWQERDLLLRLMDVKT